MPRAPRGHGGSAWPRCGHHCEGYSCSRLVSASRWPDLAWALQQGRPGTAVTEASSSGLGAGERRRGQMWGKLELLT